jgi:Domain of unknown function (DUF4158)
VWLTSLTPAGRVQVKAAAYGRFTGELPAGELERFFYLDDADRDLVARRRSDHHRLGFAVQLGTVRAVGRFLEDPLDVPWLAVEFLAEELEIGDASCVKKYVQRPQTPYEHAWEIRDRYGYRSFDGQGCAEAFARFLDGRAWTHAEGPVALFEQATGWLRRNRVLLPGVTVLARQVAAARETAEVPLVRGSGCGGPQRGPFPARAAREPAASPGRVAVLGAGAAASRAAAQLRTGDGQGAAASGAARRAGGRPCRGGRYPGQSAAGAGPYRSGEQGLGAGAAG